MRTESIGTARRATRDLLEPGSPGFSRDLRHPPKGLPQRSGGLAGAALDSRSRGTADPFAAASASIKPTSRPEGCRSPVPEDPLPPQGELASVWDAVQRALRREVTEVTFHIWLQPLEPAALLGGTLYVKAPDHIRTWVQERFRPLLGTAAKKVGATVRGVEVVAAEWEAPLLGASTAAAK